MLTKSKPQQAEELLLEARHDVKTRWELYQYLAARKPTSGNGDASTPQANDASSNSKERGQRPAQTEV